jgi:protoporphyrinogen/coproporphyrinogen III oxidase
MSITKSDSKGYVLVYETPEGIVSVQAKSVIMTIPSYIASDILRPLSVSIKLIKFYVTVN